MCCVLDVVCDGALALVVLLAASIHFAPNDNAGWHSATQQSQWEEPTGKPVAAAEPAADNADHADNADTVGTKPDDTVKTREEKAATVAEKTGTLEDKVADADDATVMVTEQAGTPEDKVKEVAETTAMVTEQTATVATLTEAWAGGGMADAPQVAVAGTMEAVPDPVQED